DQRQCLAGIDCEGDTIDRLDEGRRPPERGARGDEVLDQIADFQKGCHDTSLSSGARTQRDQWPGLTCAKGGGAAVQALSTKGHRAANRQPFGGALMFGTMPSMVARCEVR